MNAKRLLKLADFLEKLPKEKFDYGVVVCGDGTLPNKELTCGSVGCAIGWTPVALPKAAEYCGKTKGYSQTYYDVRPKGAVGRGWSHAQAGAEIFGIDRRDALALFTPGSQWRINEEDLGSDATPKQVAALIRRFVKKNSTKKVARA